MHPRRCARPRLLLSCKLTAPDAHRYPRRRGHRLPMTNQNDPGLGEAPIVVHHPAWDRHDLNDELETFLREAGTPEELRLRGDRLVFEFSEILRTVPPDALSEEQRFFVRETMTIMREHLTKLRAQAEWAVAMLSREGFRFDRSRDRLPGGGGRSAPT